MDLDRVCPECRFHGGYHAEDCSQPEPDYFAMAARTMTEQQAAAEAAHTAYTDECHDRAEYRDGPR
jgi:hypothetical protein